MSIRRVFVSSYILLVAFIGSVTALESAYWFLPLIFGFVSVLGYNLKSFFFLDIGIILSIISFLFVNSARPWNLINLILAIIIFFLFLGVWFYVRNLLFISGIENVSCVGSEESLSAFKRSALNDIFKNLFVGGFLAVLASFIGMYSDLGQNIGAEIGLLLMIVFSSTVFFIIYLIIKLLSMEDLED